MSPFENVREAFRSIRTNLLRTILTALILSIGLFALVGILTGIDAMKNSLSETFASLGANSFELHAKGYSNRGRRGGVQARQYPPISYFQARQYKKAMGDEAQVGVSAFIAGAVEMKASGIKTNPNMQVIAGRTLPINCLKELRAGVSVLRQWSALIRPGEYSLK